MTPPSARRHPRPRSRLAALAAGLLAAVLVGLGLRPTDPLEALRRHAPVPLGLRRDPAPDLGPRVERWRIPVAGGDTLTGLWRRALDSPPGASTRPYTCVLLGGLVTGNRAALLVPDSLDVHVLALDWPWWGPRRMTAFEFLRSLPEIRRAILRSPGVLALGVETAAIQPEVDPERIVLVGASLGVPPAVAALRLTSKPRACALLHGAADLRSMLRHAARGHVPQPLDVPAAAIAARWIRPLEPRLHAESLRHVPFLIVNADDDEKLPREAIDALHRAFPWAEARWESGRHLRPQRGVAIATLSREIAAWLARIDAAPGATRPRRDGSQPPNEGFARIPTASEGPARAATLDHLGGWAPGEASEGARMTGSSRERATFAGGCFWCLEAVYLELRGVESVRSGYSGGHVPQPSYEQVCSGRTGHAEVVQIEFDPRTISYRELLEVFFTIHDPTTLNRQGADVGTQYRSAIFHHSPEQKAEAELILAELEARHLWDAPIVTELRPLEAFYPAEDFHQDYFRRNASQPYCELVVAPKVAKARAQFFEKLKR